MAEGGEGGGNDSPPGRGLPGNDGLRLERSLRPQRDKSGAPRSILAAGRTLQALRQHHRADQPERPRYVALPELPEIAARQGGALATLLLNLTQRKTG